MINRAAPITPGLAVAWRQWTAGNVLGVRNPLKEGVL